jgi:hypothetical protein
MNIVSRHDEFDFGMYQSIVEPFSWPQSLCLDSSPAICEQTNSLMNIYVHKDGQQLGPFAESDVRAHLSNGNLNDTDLAWVEGNSDWQPISTILSPASSAAMSPQPMVQSPAPSVIQVVASRPLSHKGVSFAGWTLLSLCCVASLIPGLGFGVWLIAAPLLLITFVLGIIAISRGGTLHGILILIASLIVVPIFVFIAPIVTTSITLAAAKTIDKSDSSKSAPGR